VQLRPYQLDAINRARKSIQSGHKRIIVQGGCGSGKTIIAAQIIKNALAKNKKVIFLVHHRQLAFQAMERFKEFGMADNVGLIMAGEESELTRPVQVISIQTYIRRLMFDEVVNESWFQEADIVFYDEAHSSIARTRKAILELYKQTAIIVGLTATPCRADGRPLGTIYQDIVTCESTKELTDKGYLVPVVYFGSKLQPDLAGVPIVAGDYNKKILGERVNRPKLVGDILQNWLRIAPGRQTVIFATNVKHSIYIKDLFNKHGITCEHVDAHTPSEERQAILNRSAKGVTQVVTNVGVYSEGADFPWVSCIVLARPSKSYARYIQMAGRGGRIYPGKKDCFIIDHAGLVERHGFVDEPVAWTLAGDEKAWNKPKSREKEEKPPLTCDQCGCQFRGRVCPRCGFVIKSYGKQVAVVEARLHRFNRNKKRVADPVATNEIKQRFLAMAEYYRRTKRNKAGKKYKPGWTYYLYKHKFKEAPVGIYSGTNSITPIKPDKGFKNYLTHLAIRAKMGYKNRGEK